METRCQDHLLAGLGACRAGVDVAEARENLGGAASPVTRQGVLSL
jgi:hypothetical protein